MLHQICFAALLLIAPAIIRPSPVSLVVVDGWTMATVIDGALCQVDPTVAPETEALFLIGPSVITVTWINKDGKTIEIKTPCGGLDEEGCVKASAKAVAAAEKIYGGAVKKE